MGQMTYGVLYGVAMKAPKSAGDDGWYEVIRHYESFAKGRERKGSIPSTPSNNDDFEGIGFWCAVGASGEDGVPDLAGFPLDGFAGARKEFKKALDKAKREWDLFAAWCSTPQSGTMGSGEWKRSWKQAAIALPEPRLWLVETEVA